MYEQTESHYAAHIFGVRKWIPTCAVSSSEIVLDLLIIRRNLHRFVLFVFNTETYNAHE